MPSNSAALDAVLARALAAALVREIKREDIALNGRGSQFSAEAGPQSPMRGTPMNDDQILQQARHAMARWRAG